jgi:probable selenium-dependent hydroxylase accessory protein YqeC
VRLADALRVTPRRTVAFIGAGGKSTALARLAAELAADGPVVITSTAKLALSQAALAESWSFGCLVLGSLPAMLEEHRSAPSAASPAGAQVARLDLSPQIAQAIVGDGRAPPDRADGARGQSLKAPAPHEPIVPLSPTW